MATSTTNDGFHEIQLNGKQLVFLGMAVVVVSVVIFLMGVLVGRGVRTAQAPLADAPLVTAEPVANAVQVAPPAPPAEEPTPVEEEAPAAAGASAVDSLKTDKLPDLQPAAKKAAAPPTTATPAPPAATPAAVPAAAPAAKAPDTRVNVPTEPSGTGWSIQVAALADKADAEAMVTRLLGKEYSAYLVLPSGGTATYRVRVGKFKDKREADRIAGRLTKEEKFRPWVIK